MCISAFKLFPPSFFFYKTGQIIKNVISINSSFFVVCASAMNNDKQYQKGGLQKKFLTED